MLSEMRPFLTFMDVENSRTYVDDLYSSDADKCLTSLVCIKNSVIGSNRQKGNVISQGIVPRLLQLLTDKGVAGAIRLEAVITIGSLAKGTPDHVDLLLAHDTIRLLLDVLEDGDPLLIDSSLCCLRTLTLHTTKTPPNTIDYYTPGQLARLLRYASRGQPVARQACVPGILSAVCTGKREQIALAESGVPEVLVGLLAASGSDAVRVPALGCLAAMVRGNHWVATSVVKMDGPGATSVTGLLAAALSRDKSIAMQLAAAECLTNLHRAGAIGALDPLVVYRTLPCLVRLCQVEHSIEHRASAADTLAYLTEVDCELQQTTAMSNQLVAALADLLDSSYRPARRAALRTFASLGANDEDIRKRIIETGRLMEKVVESLLDVDADLRLAAVRCLHSLSRSVQQLRTSFQDHSVWRPLMALIAGTPDIELLGAASSALCNLLLQFSPAKEPMLQQGAVPLLVTLAARREPCLRLNGVWALMNLAFQAEHRVKSQILVCLGTDHIFRLLADADPLILMKTLGLLRNLVSPRAHTDTIMGQHGAQIMQAVVLVLEGPHSPDVKEQALCILANIADGEKAKEHIMANEDVLKKLTDYMVHPSNRLQAAAVFCLGNLVRRGEPGARERQAKLREMGVLNVLHQLVATPDASLFEKVKAAMTQFTDL